MSNASAKASYANRRDAVCSARRAKYAENVEYRERVKQQSAQWRADNPEKKNVGNKLWRDTYPGAKDKIKAASLKFHYGISLEQYKALILKQDSKCAACNKEFDGTKHGGPFVDHDHATGKVRAVLCHQCNTALGLLGEDPNRMIALASYTMQHLK